MDKRILDVLAKFGLVTNTRVDHEKYADVDDLINKGVVTIPGAKSKIMELLEKCGMETIEISNDETIVAPETVVEVKEDEIVEVTKVVETEVPIEEIVDAVEVVEETTVEEPVTEEAPVKEVVEITEEVATDVTPVEEVVETTELTPKKKKSTKKTDQTE